MQTQHTPGPWRIEGTNSGLFVAGAKPGYLAEVRDCGSGDLAANALLIAAAPELLSHLQFAVKLLGGMPAISATAQVDAMRSVIAKATGQA